MRHLLFATAGHVDHGKTTLIKTLTGIDTDRLPEEKRRGLTIDIGFAYVNLEKINTVVEIIDVPGHERFIKNAVAGIAPSQCLLLTVDALEGVMPQTIEHISIARAFGIKKCIGIITKSDRVPEETVKTREEEVFELLKKSGFDCMTLPFSALSPEGRGKVLLAIEEMARKIEPYPTQGKLKIILDSSFTVKGFGTVVRGSIVRGTVMEGEKVLVQPAGIEVKVRKLQNHGRFVDSATAGMRVALNIPDVRPEQVKRGFWITEAGESAPSNVLIVQTDADLKAGRMYPLFVGIYEIRARARPVDNNVWILNLLAPVLSERDERILVLTPEGKPLTGARVLHPSPSILHKRFLKERLDLLKEDFSSYLMEEEEFRKPKTNPPIEDSRDLSEEELRKLISITSGGITDEKELLKKGISPEVIRDAVRRRVLHRLEGSLLISDTALRRYIDILRSLPEPLTIQKTKEALGISRRPAVALLEYLDYLRLTIRNGNERRWTGRG